MKWGMPEHNAFIKCQYYEAIFEIQIKKYVLHR